MFGIGTLLKRPGATVGTALRRRDLPTYSPVREDEIVGLLSAVRAAQPNKRCCAIGVLSTLPGEGVSSVAQSLAAVAAKSPRVKVLLCKVPEDPYNRGPSAPFIFMETVAGVPGDRLVVGNLGGYPLAQAVSSHSGAEQSIMRSLTSQFDLVIVDLPPVSEGMLAPSLARGLDGVVLVVEAERTRAHALRAARKSIEACGGKIIGVVLNKRRYHIPEFIYRLL